MKRTLSIVFALALTIPFITPSFAANNEDDISIANIIFPMDISFFIDPFELNGNGQIYSEEYVIQNCGTIDTLIDIPSFYYSFANNEDFVSLDHPFEEDEKSDYKAIYLTVQFSDGQTLVLSDSLQQQRLSFSLKCNDTIQFKFSGSVNHEPLKHWQNSDVTVHMEYLLTADDIIDEDNVIEDSDVIDKAEEDVTSQEEVQQLEEPEPLPQPSNEQESTEQENSLPDPSSDPEQTNTTNEVFEDDS